MKVEGSYALDAPPERVWALLLDPASLASCLPGCERLEPVGDDEYLATVALGIAAFKGTYQGRVRVADKTPFRQLTLLVEGSGRPGFVKGSGQITLEPRDGTGTQVNVQGDAQVGGPVLSVGSRLVAPTAKLLMGQFFSKLRQLAAAPVGRTSRSIR